MQTWCLLHKPMSYWQQRMWWTYSTWREDCPDPWFDRADSVLGLRRLKRARSGKGCYNPSVEERWPRKLMGSTPQAADTRLCRCSMNLGLSRVNDSWVFTPHNQPSYFCQASHDCWTLSSWIWVSGHSTIKSEWQEYDCSFVQQKLWGSFREFMLADRSVQE